MGAPYLARTLRQMWDSTALHSIAVGQAGLLKHPQSRKSALSIHTMLTSHNLKQVALRSRPGRNSLLRELARSVIPVQRGDAAASFLIGVSLSVVLIKGEVAVRAGINADLGQLLYLSLIHI